MAVHPPAEPMASQALEQLLPAALRPLQGLASAADLLRSRLLALLGRPLKPWLLDRELRVATVGAGLTALALAMAALVPVWVLALGPLVWGVPHLLADVRYLVVRQGLHRHRLVATVAVAALALAAFTELGVRATLLGCAAVALAMPGSLKKRLAVAGLALGLAAMAWPLGWTADLLLAHAHNGIALAIWWVWRPRTGQLHWWPVALVAAGLALLLSGALDSLAVHSGPTAALNLEDLAWQLAPADDAAWSQRWAVSFAFAQTVHYVAWIHLVPSEDRVRSVPRSFQSSLKALQTDLGGPLLLLAAGIAVALALGACFDLAAARDRYFQLAWFHGHLELMAAAWLLVRGVRRASPIDRDPLDCGRDPTQGDLVSTAGGA